MDVTDIATYWFASVRPSPPQRVPGFRPRGEFVDFANDLPPDGVDEIASLLARGFLRYWKSQRLRPLIAESRLVRRQLFLWVDDNYFSRSTTITF